MSSSNVNPILLDAKWSIDCKLWQVTVENPAISGRRVKWTRFRGPIASMRQTSRLMVDGEKTLVILFRTTDQEDDAPEFAGRLSNFVVTKVSPAAVRKAIGKKTKAPLARKFMHMIVLCVIVFRVCIGFVCKSFKTWLKEQQVESESGSDFDEDLEMEREERRKAGQQAEPGQHDDEEHSAADSLLSQASHPSRRSSRSRSPPESPEAMPRPPSSSRDGRRSILADPTPPAVPAEHVTPQTSRSLAQKRPRSERSNSSHNSQSSGSRRRTASKTASKRKKAKVSSKSRPRLQPLQGT